jgi:hypothetical protein
MPQRRVKSGRISRSSQSNRNHPLLTMARELKMEVEYISKKLLKDQLGMQFSLMKILSQENWVPIQMTNGNTLVFGLNTKLNNKLKILICVKLKAQMLSDLKSPVMFMFIMMTLSNGMVQEMTNANHFSLLLTEEDAVGILKSQCQVSLSSQEPL